MTNDRPIRVGTRASALATTQSGAVADALREATGRPVELVPIRTEGDRTTASLASLGGAGVFVVALRQALLDGACDVAVHSLKDLPTAPAPGLAVGAVPRRADPRDVLCARSGWTLTTLPHGARVGTGSPRRGAQLLLARPDLEIVDIRGNVGTRLSRVAPGDLDAVVLARAGLERLDRLEPVSETLAPEVMLPAPGQGALAVECRTEALAPGELGTAMAALDDLPTRLAVTAERAVLRTLEAGCAAPVGAHAWVDPAAHELHLRAAAVDPAGSRRLRREATVSFPAGDHGPARREAEDRADAMGRGVAGELLGDGAAELAGLPGAGR